MSKILARVTVSVPASTSNLGPGFDSFGLALGLNVHDGKVTNEGVASAHGLNASSIADALA